MAPGDSGFMSWQVLLTISMVLTPVFAHHGKCAAPTLCMCGALIRARKRMDVMLEDSIVKMAGS